MRVSRARALDDGRDGRRGVDVHGDDEFRRHPVPVSSAQEFDVEEVRLHLFLALALVVPDAVRELTAVEEDVRVAGGVPRAAHRSQKSHPASRSRGGRVVVPAAVFRLLLFGRRSQRRVQQVFAEFQEGIRGVEMHGARARARWWRRASRARPSGPRC